jgi:hypothetical protein
MIKPSCEPLAEFHPTVNHLRGSPFAALAAGKVVEALTPVGFGRLAEAGVTESSKANKPHKAGHFSLKVADCLIR